MRINNNLMAMNTHRQLGAANAGGAKSMEKLSSGFRINRAGDDAAGLAISEKMRGQIRGLNQASSNAQDGISMIQTAEGALNETHSILQRMRELAVQSSNGTTTDDDRKNIQDELNQLTSEINRIGNTTEFNTQKVLNGGIGDSGAGNVTKATSAQVTGDSDFTVANLSALSAGDVTITVDNITFDLSEALSKEWDDADFGGTGIAATRDDVIAAIKDVTAGGVKLSELVEMEAVTVDDGAGNDIDVIQFTNKSTGTTSGIEFTVVSGAEDVLTVSDDVEETGAPATIERHGIQAGTILGNASTDNTITAGSTFKVTVGNESAVTVTFNEGKTYNTANTDANVAKAAMEDLVKDLNAAIQQAGISDKVTASLSKDNEVQFVSETGKDIKLEGSSLVDIGFSATGEAITETVKNIEQVVGPGAQGSGFNTTFQIGANTGQSMSLNIADMRSAAIGITGNAGQAGFTSGNTVNNGTSDILNEAALNVSNKEDASKAIDIIDSAISRVSEQRGNLGAVQNRLEHTIKNLDTSSENLQASEARIRDVDMAKEMMEHTKQNILSQAATAMLAQANQAPQAVLQLLR